MEITSEININGYSWEIIEKEIINNDENYQGMTDYHELKIYIKKLDKMNMINALKHELTHAFIYSYGMLYVKFNLETICEFVAHYSEKINNLANNYFKEELDGNLTIKRLIDLANREKEKYIYNNENLSWINKNICGELDNIIEKLELLKNE